MWAAAPVTEEFKALGGSVKAKSFHGFPSKLASAVALHVSLHIHSICEVQERLLEAGPNCFRVFPRGRLGRT